MGWQRVVISCTIFTRREHTSRRVLYASPYVEGINHSVDLLRCVKIKLVTRSQIGVFLITTVLIKEPAEARMRTIECDCIDRLELIILCRRGGIGWTDTPVQKSMKISVICRKITVRIFNCDGHTINGHRIGGNIFLQQPSRRWPTPIVYAIKTRFGFKEKIAAIVICYNIIYPGRVTYY